MLDHAWHRSDRLRLGHSLPHEHRQDQVGWSDGHLGGQPAQRGRGPQPPRPRHRKPRQDGKFGHEERGYARCRERGPEDARETPVGLVEVPLGADGPGSEPAGSGGQIAAAFEQFADEDAFREITAALGPQLPTGPADTCRQHVGVEHRAAQRDNHRGADRCSHSARRKSSSGDQVPPSQAGASKSKGVLEEQTDQAPDRTIVSLEIHALAVALVQRDPLDRLRCRRCFGPERIDVCHMQRRRGTPPTLSGSAGWQARAAG